MRKFELGKFLKLDFSIQKINFGITERIKSLSLSVVFYNLLLFFLLIISLYPLLWLVFTSLRSLPELTTDPWGFPTKLYLDNYIKVWKTSDVSIFFANSVIVTSISVFLIVLFSSMAAYAFARLKFRWSNILFYGLIGFYFVPPHITLVPLINILRFFHLTNTYFALIGPYVAFGIPFSTLLIKGFMVSIPTELIDAALIDGCSKIGIFTKIILPISKPILAVVTIFQGVTLWNEYLFALVFVNERELMTLPIGLMDFVGEFITDWTAIAAGLVISTIPILLLYLVFQRQIIEGMTAGALKG